MGMDMPSNRPTWFMRRPARDRSRLFLVLPCMSLQNHSRSSKAGPQLWTTGIFRCATRHLRCPQPCGWNGAAAVVPPGTNRAGRPPLWASRHLCERCPQVCPGTRVREALPKILRAPAGVHAGAPSCVLPGRHGKGSPHAGMDRSSEVMRGPGGPCRFLPGGRTGLMVQRGRRFATAQWRPARHCLWHASVRAEPGPGGATLGPCHGPGGCFLLFLESFYKTIGIVVRVGPRCGQAMFPQCWQALGFVTSLWPEEG
ncbi:hypothetical protein SAMN04489708_11584 [Paracidovorax cattleyae]|uniref:Uncharacterized protein n=1 Tax=Paracidovorax cattleyae TaxID=80868 RepID=A0A1H0TIY8_9BURK|nr:hypothetical protein SAMN04489708_11584 [Paracidovorax cattleyae]